MNKPMAPLMFALGFLLVFALLLPAAHAELVGTEQMLEAPAVTAGQDRARVTALLARPAVARQLQAMGVAPEEALTRVNAMSDSEVRSLAGKLDTLPAAGGWDNFQVAVVVLLAVLVALAL